MTDNAEKARQRLLRLADALAEDVMALSDEEILAEAEEDGVDLREVSKRFNAMLDKALAERPRMKK